MITTKQKGILNEARFAVLRVLDQALEPVGLREISYRADLSIASIQAATKSLLRSGHIRKVAVPPWFMFAKQPHREWPALEAMFRAMGSQLSKSTVVNDPQGALRALDDMFIFSKQLHRAAGESRRSV